MASAGPWGYLRRLRSFGGGVWFFSIRDAKTVRMMRFVRSTIFEVRPRPGRGCWGTRDKTTLAAATAHVRFASRLVWTCRALKATQRLYWLLGVGASTQCGSSSWRALISTSPGRMARPPGSGRASAANTTLQRCWRQQVPSDVAGRPWPLSEEPAPHADQAHSRTEKSAAGVEHWTQGRLHAT